MTPREALASAILPAYAILPERMASARASAMLLAIGLQESRLTHRHQIVVRADGSAGRGPARGLWQFEPGGGVRGVRRHPATGRSAAQVLLERNVDLHASDAVVADALAEDDVLAAAFARLLLWTLPAALPGPFDDAEGWRQYLEAWRPGKPHPATWARFYGDAWSATT